MLECNRVDKTKSSYMPTSMSKEEFDRFYLQEVDALHRFVIVRVRNRVDAEDITAEAFTRLLGKIETETVRSPRGYLYQIARNCITDHFHSGKGVVSIEAEESQRSEDGMGGLTAVDRVSIQKSAEQLDGIEQGMFVNSRVARVLSHCSDEDRLLLSLRYQEDLGWNDVAERLGISVISVRVRHHRLIRAIRKILQEQSDE